MNRVAAIGLTIFSLSGTAFAIVLAQVVRGGAMVEWDADVAAWMHLHGTAAGNRLCVAISFLGLPSTWIIGVVVGLVLLWRRRAHLLAAWIVANGGGGLLEQLVKQAVNRPRPLYAMTFLARYSPSFPSGHAMASAICYIALVFTVTRCVSMDRSRSVLLYGLAILMIAVIAFSRVYLAVHYPSDVIGGLLIAAAWLALCLTTTILVEANSQLS
jgi:undecaprenyl-diphosphatase